MDQLTPGMMQLLHISLEIVIVSIITYMLNSKINTVIKENEMMKNEIAQMRQMIDRQNQIIGNIMQLHSPQHPAKPAPKKSSKSKKKSSKTPPPPPSPSESSDDEEEFNDEELGKELQEGDDGTISSVDEEVEIEV